ncbi:reverse transcriptase [Tanacetum coccineum]
MKWLSLAEWWYNTNHHSTINTTPYEIVYGQIPPIHVPYVGGDNRVESVDRTLTARKEAIETHLKYTMSSTSHNLRNGKERCHKSGDLPICNEQGVMKVEPVAILDRRLAKRANVVAIFVLVEPVAILDRRLAKRANVVVVFVLVQWANRTKNNATWNPLSKFKRISLLSKFDLEDKISLRGMDCYKSRSDLWVSASTGDEQQQILASTDNEQQRVPTEERQDLGS